MFDGMISGGSMKFKAVSVALICIAASGLLHATYKRKPVQSQVASGVYVPADVITRLKLKDMPIPSSGQDYALYQSIGAVTNVVIAEFRSGLNRLTLASDTNSDGEVDILVYWYADSRKFRDVSRPGEVISKERFLEMKKAIVAGVNSDIHPNPEGVPFLKRLVLERETKTMRIAKSRNGYVITLQDPDDQGRNRILFSFSNNGINGVDLNFDVIYRNVGENSMAPVIRQCVFASGSRDPFAKQIVEELGKHLMDNYRE
jgi:hypothetical protein